MTAPTSLLRSKSAPHALVDEPTRFTSAKLSHLQPYTSHGHVHGQGQSRKRAATHAHAHTPYTDADLLALPTLTVDGLSDAYGGSPTTMTPMLTPSPLDAPNEDPFSLVGFFPSRPGSPHTPATTAWIGGGDSGALEDDEERTAGEKVLLEVKDVEHARGGEHEKLSRRVFSLTALDDYARSVIAEESAVGIFRLARRWFSPREEKEEMIGEEDSEEEDEDEEDEKGWMLEAEPYDGETLYAALCARRTRSQGEKPEDFGQAVVIVPSLFAPE